MAQTISHILVLLGASFALIGSIGLARFPDIYTRLHGPTKATTLGVGSILVGSVITLSTQGEELAIRELLITVFLFLSSAMLLLGNGQRKGLAVTLAAIVSLAGWALFIWAFETRFPAGPFEKLMSGLL